MIQSKEILTSRQNPTVKWVSSLAQGKYRKSERCFLAEGKKLTMEALSSGLPVSHVIVAESAKTNFMTDFSAFLNDEKHENAQLLTVSDDVFSKISTENAPQGILCVIKYLDFFRDLDIIYREDTVFSYNNRILALESVRDPGNLGSVIRSAVAFGVDHIILSADCADIYHPKTVRSAMGSLFRVKVTVVRDFSSFVKAGIAVGRKVYSAELDRDALPLTHGLLTSTDVVIIGNEGHGVSKETSALCSSKVFIPISLKTESLNAAVAAAVFMWEQTQG